MTLAFAGPIPEQLVELGALLAGLALLGRIAHRVGLSPIPLYLVAGLFLGDGGIHDLAASRDAIEIGAAIGIVLLPLMLGLEYSAGELLDGLRENRPAAIVDLVANAAPGFVAAWVLGWSFTAAAFLGGITYVSSSGITAKVLHDLRRIGNRETPTVLSLLVVQDLVMAVYLPVVTGLAVAANASEALADVAIALTAVAVAFAVSLKLGELVSRLVASTSAELLVLMVLGVGLLLAGGAEQLGAPAAVAALLLGIALSGSVAADTRRVLTPLRDVFGAVFFVSFGLAIEPSAVPAVLPAAGALALVGALTKVATGMWAAARGGIGFAGRLRAGSVLVARGEFSVILAGIALAQGVEPQLPEVVAVYVLLTACAGPMLTRIADPAARTIEGRLLGEPPGARSALPR